MGALNRRRSRPRAERGVLLPLLALALAGGGLLWIAGTRGGSVERAHEARSSAREPLLDARLALIAHAAAYPESYGPLGAGPGHLVCPDTDTPLERRASGPTGRPAGGFGGDGPNPPCGGGPLALGRLPRHVSLGGSRRAFHHESTQRLVYGVSSGYVNNPPGAAVHRVPDATSSAHEVVAVIVDPGGVSLPSRVLAGARDPRELLALVREAVGREAGRATARSLPHVFVTRGDLIGVAERRVAAWFVETATRVARRRGEATSDDPPPPGVAVPGDPSSPGATIRLPLPLACPEDDGAVGVLRWVADDEVSTCAAPVATIENTPRERHWFVREGWASALEVRRDAACEGDARSCRFAIARAGGGRRESTVSGASRIPVPTVRPTGSTIVIELAPRTAPDAPGPPAGAGPVPSRR